MMGTTAVSYTHLTLPTNREGYDAVGTGNNYPYVLVSLVELEYEVSSQFFF